MMSDEKIILNQIKSAVHEIVPDAKVMLFGSRVTGKVHDESDWDILVLTKEKKPMETKRAIQAKLYDVSLSIGSFISLILSTDREWRSDPRFYSLQLNIANDFIAL